MKIKTLTALKIKVGGEIRELVPGQTVELTEAQGQRLLAQAPGRVRVVSEGPRPRERSLQGQLSSSGFVWWEGSNGILHGPARVELLALTEDGLAWVGVEYAGTFRWIRADLIKRYRRT